MIILNQDLELVNFDRLAKVSIFSGEIENTTVYAIVAFESVSDDDNEDAISPDALMLGIYNNESECSEVFLSLCEAIENGKNMYRMPEPANEGVTS
ncbi:hypothetical protein [Ruminococcus sp.]